MERTMGPALQNISACRIQLRVEFTEIIMDGSGPEHTDTPALALLYLKPLCLDDHTEALNKKDATEDRK